MGQNNEHESSKDVEPIEGAVRFAQNLTRFMEDQNDKETLRPHQQTVLSDLSKYLSEGGRRGYVEMPTGTGKTVLFVTLARALGYGDANPPRILVVEPTIDLVRQTSGGGEGNKGFAGFAPDMRVNTFYSETNTAMEDPIASVTVTTYASFNKLGREEEVTIINNVVQSRYVNRVNEDYDVVFLDEGHRAQGEVSREIIQQLVHSKIVIGFSATPDYSPQRKLKEVLPDRIHTLDLEESIELGMLSPVVPFAVHSPNGHEYRLTASGNDYEQKSLKEMIYDEARNNMIVDMARMAIESGNSPIISCIPGGSMIHPDIIADLASQQEYVGDDGVRRPMNIRAVTSRLSGEERQAIYQDFEAGRVHGLAYIDVLNEGWDSQRANTLIVARPTRSLLVARQRAGRVLRSKTDGRPAYIVDIVSDITSDSIPPVTPADVLKMPFAYSGKPVGRIKPNQVESAVEFISNVSEQFGYLEYMSDAHTQYMNELHNLPSARNGHIMVETSGKMKAYATASRLYDKLKVTDTYLAKLIENGVGRHPVRIGERAVDSYSEEEVLEHLRKLPEEPLKGRYFLGDDQQFMRIDDILEILDTKYEVQISDRQLLDEFLRLEAQDAERFAKHYVATTHKGVSLYSLSTLLRKDVAQLLVGKLKESD